MPISNIIFDWSGVISNDHHTVYLTTNKTFRRLGLKEIGYDEFTKHFLLPYMDFYKLYRDIDKRTISAIYQEECRTTPMPEVFPEVRDVLKALKSSGMRMALFTAMNRPRLDEEMRHMDVEKYFSIIKSDMHDKVADIRQFVNEHGFKRENTIYVGDMVHDIHAAKQAGIRIAAVTRGYDSREKLRKENPDWLIDSLDELPGIVNGLDNQ